MGPSIAPPLTVWDGRSCVFANTGNGNFPSTATWTYSSFSTPISAVIADLNADSWNDIAAASWSAGRVKLLLNTKNTAAPFPVTPTESPWGAVTAAWQVPAA